MATSRQIDSAALKANLPPMLLQLLVENAIKHGIARTPGGGCVGIQAHLANGMLQLTVSNPGRIDPHSRGHGVGLAYLRARLDQGLPGARFVLEPRGDEVQARLEIPQ